MSQPAAPLSTPLLFAGTDPAPYSTVNAKSDYPVVLVCEHAGQAIPRQLGDLGISQAALDSHIGWDIGAGGVTRCLAEALGAPAIFQSYSRLVIDCNRPVDAPDAMPEISDGIVIPANRNLDTPARNARVDEIFAPFHAAIDNLVAQSPRRVLLSIHSFTARLAGIQRPWDMGFLYREDTHTSTRLAAHIKAQQPALIIGLQQPYIIDDDADWFVPVHGEQRGMAHSLIEIRNDHIETSETQIHWAHLLEETIRRLLKDL
jgi:predicted N-formylglutamate amidohydrolase